VIEGASMFIHRKVYESDKRKTEFSKSNYDNIWNNPDKMKILFLYYISKELKKKNSL